MDGPQASHVLSLCPMLYIYSPADPMRLYTTRSHCKDLPREQEHDGSVTRAQESLGGIEFWNTGGTEGKYRGREAWLHLATGAL